MSLRSLCTDDVVIITPIYTTDQYGNTEKDWNNAIRTPAKGWMAQGATNEVEGNRETDISIWRLYLVDLSVSITAQDRVWYDGAYFDVQGKPVIAKTPGKLHHIEAILRLVEG